MAVYKVPQDVEAEDKLIGPFSFRQFIYLIVAALGILMAWLLSQIFIGFIIIPMPIIVAFLALALPLRKDQPMETYLIAMIKFFFKPRRRVWDPEGTISLVQVTAARAMDGPQLKGVGGSEAGQRLAYLAQVVDTQGWSTRGAMSANDNLSDIFVAESSQVEDVLDQSSGVAQAFNQRIAQADDARLEAARQQMQAAAIPVVPTVAQPQTPPEPATSGNTIASPQDTPQEQPATGEDTLPIDLHYDPYPSSMHQKVIRPAGSTPAPTTTPVTSPAEKQPSAETVSPDIMRLANNNDLSISALAREAQRISSNDEEVVISLR